VLLTYPIQVLQLRFCNFRLGCEWLYAGLGQNRIFGDLLAKIPCISIWFWSTLVVPCYMWSISVAVAVCAMQLITICLHAHCLCNNSLYHCAFTKCYNVMLSACNRQALVNIPVRWWKFISPSDRNVSLSMFSILPRALMQKTALGLGVMNAYLFGKKLTVGQNHTFIRIHIVHTVFLAGRSPYIRSYTVCI